MVHKKYTFKNGKQYGPYLYENKRVGEKVVTTYVGKDSHKILSIVIISVVLAAILLSVLVYRSFSPTGQVSLDIDSSYNYGEQLDGTLKLSLKNGELLPADAIVRVRNGQSEISMPLSALLSQSQSEGNFYAEGSSISGSGSGYGTAGTKSYYPVVDFELTISSSSQTSPSNESSSSSGGGSSSSEETPQTDPSQTPASTTPDTTTVPTTSEPSTTENTPESDSGRETTTQTTAQTPAEETTSSTSTDTTADASASTESSSESTSSDSSSSESSSESTSSSTSSTSSSSSESSSSSSSDSSSSSSDSSSDSSSSGITGAVIGEDEYTISGSASKGSDFNYNLEEGQDAAIRSGSVKVNSESVSDSEIDLSVSDNKATVTTDYEVSESGFGQEYITEEITVLPIDLSLFGINVTDSNLQISVEYGHESIVSVSKDINVINEPVDALNDTNITVPLPPVNATLNDTNITIPIINETIVINLSIRQTKAIPTIRIGQNSSEIIDLEEYFDGSDEYSINVSDILTFVNGSMLTLTAPDGFFGARQARIYASNENDTLESNPFNILVSKGIAITTARDKIVVGEDVRWVKNIALDEPQNLTVELPAGSRNISVNVVENEKKDKPAVVEFGNETTSMINALVVADIDTGKELGIVKFFKKLFSSFTGRVVDSSETSNETVEITLVDNATAYTIEYYTPAPKINETLIENGKQITISASDELNYTDVIAFTNLSYEIPAEQLGNIKLYWESSDASSSATAVKSVSQVENTTIVEDAIIDLNGSVISTILARESNSSEAGVYLRQEMPFDAYDLDFNGMYDYIEWVVPHLSSQTFTLAMNTTNTIVSNITFDGNYSRLNVDRSKAPYSNLLGYWAYDYNISGEIGGDSNGANVSDYSGLNRQADMRGANVVIAPGLYGGAFYASNKSASPDWKNQSTIPRYSAFMPRSFTFTAWLMLPTVPASGDYAIVKSAGGSGYFDGWRCNSGGADIWCAVANSTTYWSAVPAYGVLQSGNWTHIALAYNSTTGNVTLFANGNLAYMDKMVRNSGLGVYYSSSTSWMSIGSVENFGINTWPGYIDEVMFFNSSLTAQQVRDIYNNQSARFVAQGYMEGRQFNISRQGDLSINFTIDDFFMYADANISASIGRWDVSRGYNDTAPGLRGYYHADGNANDASGNGFTGTLQLGATATSPGIYNNSFYFDGSNDYVSTADMDLGQNFTLAAWIYPNSVTPVSIITKNYPGSGSIPYGLGFGMDDGTSTMQVGFWTGSAWYTARTPGALSAGKWYHVVGIKNDSTLRMYVDGVLVNTTVGVPNTVENNELTYIGRRHDSFFGSTSFNGYVDEAMMYNRSLSDSEVKELFVKGRPNWEYTSYTEFIKVNDTRAVATLEILNTTTNIFPRFKLSASSFFATPLLSNKYASPVNFTFSINDFGDPVLGFVDPTPTNRSTFNSTSLYINMSVNDASQKYTLLDLDNDLLVWLRMEEINSTSNGTTDSSSYNRSVTMVGAAAQSASGKFGKSMTIRNDTESYLIWNMTEQEYSSALTWCAWFNVSSRQSDYTALLNARTSGGNSNGIALMADGKYRVFVDNETEGESWYASSASYPLNSWTQVCHSYSASNGSLLYINGAFDTTGPKKGNLYIGTRFTAGTDYSYGRYLNGSMDEVVMFDRALSATEISALYNHTASYYQFNYSLANDAHRFQGFAVDLYGHIGQTDLIFLKRSGLDLSECTNITSAGTYNMTSHIGASNFTSLGCMNISASNVVFDCAGYSIANRASTGKGIFVTGENVTVKNCNVSVSPSASSAGIYVYPAALNSTILNNSVYWSYYGIYVAAPRGNITSNTLFGNAQNGITLVSTAQNNTVLLNTATNNTLKGIYLLNVNWTTILNNTVINNSQDGIYIENSAHDIIANNTATNNTQSGIYVYTALSINSTIINNIVNGNKYAGIYLYAVSNSTTANNTAYNNTYGIYLYFSPFNITVSNNNASLNSLYGVFSQLSSNNIIKNNILTKNSNSGIYLDTSTNTTIFNNTATQHSSAYGIFLIGSSDNNVTNNTLNGNTYGLQLISFAYRNFIFNNNASLNSYGISIDSFSRNNSIIENEVNSNSVDGLTVSSATNVLVINNTVNRNTRDGIAISSGSNNTIDRNVVYKNNRYGINIDTTFNSNITNNNVSANTLYGIYLNGARNNTLANNSIIGNQHGVYISSSSRNVVINSNMSSNSASGVYLGGASNHNNSVINSFLNSNAQGVALGGTAVNNLIFNSTINGSTQYAISFTSAGNAENNFTNLSISSSTQGDLYILGAADNNRFINTPLAGFNIIGASKLIFESTDIGQIQFLTGVSGAGVNLSSNIKIGSNNAEVNASGSANSLDQMANITLYNIPSLINPMMLRDGSTCPEEICTNYTSLEGPTVKFRVVGWSNYSIGNISLSPNLVLSSCARIYAQGNYSLSRSFVADDFFSWGCINITVPDVELDCKGYSIINTSSTGSRVAISLHGANTTVKGCNIGLSKSSIATGIYLYPGAINSTLFNNTVNGSYYGIYIPAIGPVKVVNNSLTDAALYGLYASGTQNSSFINNTLSFSGTGIYILNARNNSFVSNTEIGISTYGILLDGSQNNSLMDSLLVNMTSRGIALINSLNNTISNMTIASNSTSNMYGIYVSVSNGTLVSGNKLRGFKTGQVYVDTRSFNTKVKNNLIENCTGPSDSGIYVLSSNYSEVSGNTISGCYYGINIQSSAYGTVENNTLFNNSQYGILAAFLRNSVITRNNVNTSYNGIWVGGSSNVNVTHNTLNYNAQSGLYLSSAWTAFEYSNTNVKAVNNTANSNTLYGIYVTRTGAELENNTANGNLGAGIYTNDPLASVLFTNTLLSSNMYGIYSDFRTASGTRFNNVTIENSLGNAIYIYSTQSNGLAIVNSTITGTAPSGSDLAVPTGKMELLHLNNTAIGKYAIDGTLTLKLGKDDVGSIDFLQSISGSGANLSSDIQLRNNYAYVNPVRTGLNKPANITLVNLTSFVNGKVLRNGATCPSSVCFNFTALDGTEAKFNVTAWSYYSIGNVSLLYVTNCTNGCLYIRNSTGNNRSIFDKEGNLDLAGIIVESSVGTPDGKDFIVKNSSGDVVAWIDDTTGNIRLAGRLFDEQADECNPSGNTFAIKNTSGSCVAYINSTGSLWLKGVVNENDGI